MALVPGGGADQGVVVRVHALKRRVLDLVLSKPPSPLHPHPTISASALAARYERLTTSVPGTLHYHPVPSPDGEWLAYSKRDGVPEVFLMRLADRQERQMTHSKPGHAGMWPYWQPASQPGADKVPAPGR